MKKKSLYFIVSLVFGSLLFEVGFAEEKPPPMPTIVKILVGEAKKSASSIDMQTLKTALDNKEDVTILDVRLPEEYAAGHIPRAINIPRGLLEFLVWKKVVGFPECGDTSRKIYIYCREGNRAALATKSLQELGFINAILVDMKIAEWRKAGYPIEK